MVFESNVEKALPIAVQAVLAGQITVPRQTRCTAQAPALSHRERQLLRMAVLGSTDADIVTELHLPERTVMGHLSSALAKLGVSSREEAAALVLDPTEIVSAGILGSSLAPAVQGSRGRP